MTGVQTCALPIYGDHLVSNKIPKVAQSFFRFHVYYQTRKILNELCCPLRGDPAINDSKNAINLTEFKRIANQFNVIRKQIGVVKVVKIMVGHNVYKGLSLYTAKKLYNNDPNKFKFISQLSKIEPYTIDFILQDDANGLMHFIILNSRGFSRSGVERINDSIRSYVYCIMSAQAQTRSPIIWNSGPSFDAQK